MKSRKVLTQIIELIDTFEANNPHLEEYNINDFLSYLESQSYGGKQDALTTGLMREINLSGIKVHENRANIISRQVSLVYRYVKEYTKKGLEGSDLKTIEEFSYLIVLMAYDSLTKTELIQKNAMGKTSGIEVIKRLLQKNLIKQFADTKDRRSQRVKITHEGIMEMRKIFPQVQSASDVIAGNLSQSEQQTLIFLLQKLNMHHHEIFLNHLDKSLNEIREIQKSRS